MAIAGRGPLSCEASGTGNAPGCLTAILKTLQKDSDVAAARIRLASGISISDPDEVDELEGLPRPRRPVSEIAVLGGHENDLTIAGGYLKVAEVAERYWIDHGPDDSMPIPILYNYRHAIELTLKWLIRLAARYLEESGFTEENLRPDKLDKKLETHNVKRLADRLDRYLGLLEIRAPDKH